MSKIVLMGSVSLDGFFEGPDRDIGWHRVDEELHDHFNELLRDAGAFLEGRVTYELMNGYWPTAGQDPSASRPEREFARIWRDTPKYVFSRTLQHADPDTTILRDVVLEEILRLKAELRGDLVLGGADVGTAFRREGLVDEYRIYVHPVVIGAGRPLLPPLEGRVLPLRLVESRVFGSGVVLLRYEPSA